MQSNLKSFYGLDHLNLDLREVKHTVWVTDCLGKQLFSRQQGFDGNSKRDTQTEKPVHGVSNPLHAGRDPMPIEKQLRVLRRRPIVEKDSQHREARKIVTRRTLHVLGQHPRSSSPQRCQTGKSLSVHLVRETVEIHEQRELRNMLSEDQFAKQPVDPLYNRAIQEHSGVKI